MAKNVNNRTELEKMIGKRVKECRNAAGITQQELADKCDFKSGESYISTIENGTNPLSYKAAEKIGTALGVSADYLMFKTDRKHPRSMYGETYFTEDQKFLECLLQRAYDIKASVILIYEEKQPKKLVSINEIDGFDFGDPHCKYRTPVSVHEAIITDISVNGFQMPFYIFCFIMEMMYNYIDYTLDNIHTFAEQFFAHHAGNLATENEISESFPAGESSPQNLLKSLVKQGYDAELLSDGTLKINSAPKI